MTKIFGRELAVWLAFIAAVIGVLTSFGINVDPHVQGWITAVVVFVFAVVAAVALHDGIIALATGVVTAAFSLFAAFGLEWPAEKQGYILGALTVILGFFVRTQATSSVPATASPAGKLVVHE
jgi:uncharacterized membrane protein